MGNKEILNVIGIILLTLGILAVIISLSTREPAHVFWFCYISLILIGIGMMSKNSTLIASQLNIITIPAIFWNIDFFYNLIAGNPLWNITNYLIGAKILSLSYLISMQHVFTIPLTLYSLYLLKLKRKDFWKISAFQIVALFILSYIFSSVPGNINCVLEPCFSFFNQYIKVNYTLFWFLGIFAIISITNYLLVKIFYKKHEKTKNSSPGAIRRG